MINCNDTVLKQFIGQIFVETPSRRIKAVISVEYQAKQQNKMV
jgi:hypothetical protein